MTKSLNEFISNFSEQILEEVGNVELIPETKFRELEEWSSLTALIFIMMVDEKYNVKITGDDIRQSVTIHDLYSLITSKL